MTPISNMRIDCNEGSDKAEGLNKKIAKCVINDIIQCNKYAMIRI